jgi:hypothetical protein
MSTLEFTRICLKLQEDVRTPRPGNSNAIGH